MDGHAHHRAAVTASPRPPAQCMAPAEAFPHTFRPSISEYFLLTLDAKQEWHTEADNGTLDYRMKTSRKKV